MGVTIEVENTFGEVIKRERVQNLDSNFFTVADKLISKGCALGLRNYYEYNRVFVEDEVFPFIIRNNKCEWHVPINKVTIKDFMVTHEIGDEGTISVNEVRLGVGDPYFYIDDLISWVLVLWPIVSNAVTLAEVIKVAGSFYHKLIGNDKKAIKPYEYLELLRTREKWTMAEIKELTHCYDEIGIEKLLLIGDFRKEDGRYIRNHPQEKEYPLSDYLEYISKNADDCWGGDDINLGNELRDAAEAIKHLNCALANLLIQSDYSHSNYFEVMMLIIDRFLEKWDHFISKGSMFHFVIINKNTDNYMDEYGNESYSDLSMLEYEIGILTEYAYCLCEKLN